VKGKREKEEGKRAGRGNCRKGHFPFPVFLSPFSLPTFPFSLPRFVFSLTAEPSRSTPWRERGGPIGKRPATPPLWCDPKRKSCGRDELRRFAKTTTRRPALTVPHRPTTRDRGARSGIAWWDARGLPPGQLDQMDAQTYTRPLRAGPSPILARATLLGAVIAPGSQSGIPRSFLIDTFGPGYVRRSSSPATKACDIRSAEAGWPRGRW
jgi:hypothetical protein